MQLVITRGRVAAALADGADADLSGYAEGSFVVPYDGPPDPAGLLGHPMPAIDLAAYAAAKRYAVEVAGATAVVGGARVPVSTARADRANYQSVLLAIMMGLRASPSVFKFADGVPRPATNDEMEAAIGAAYAHVQAAYDREATARSMIANGSVSDIAGVDAILDPAAAG